MSADSSQIEIRTATDADISELAELRNLWTKPDRSDPGFAERLAAWFADEGERRTTWLALLGNEAVGMASVFEYRRMPAPNSPDSRWGYVSSAFVREDRRNRGIGAAILNELISTAERRGYVRLVVGPSTQSMTFWRRAGFITPDHASGGGKLLIRPVGGVPSPSS